MSGALLESAERGRCRCVFCCVVVVVIVVLVIPRGRGKVEMIIIGRVLGCPAEKGVCVQVVEEG